LFCSRGTLLLENLALRQQLVVLKRRHPRKRLQAMDRLFWLVMRGILPGWKESLIVVTPETVVRWHGAGFKTYWRWISRTRHPVGRRLISKEVRDLIFRMMSENPTWGAPRIHGELHMLGFDVSERAISRWMRKMPRHTEPGQGWLTFLRNHHEAIAAMDFFTVPTIRFSLLYCFFVISHDRRRILHINVTSHPTAPWIVQQLRETFPFRPSHKYLILDRDKKYGLEVLASIRSMQINPVQTSFQSPWQNGIAERWVESCRQDLLDHVIALNESHLKRLINEYVRYYHQDRTHLGLGKQTPGGRQCSSGKGAVISGPRLGGLHHRYERAA
jgi:transposase InsO family protein